MSDMNGLLVREKSSINHLFKIFVCFVTCAMCKISLIDSQGCSLRIKLTKKHLI